MAGAAAGGVAEVRTVESDGPATTRRLAARLGAIVRPGDVVALTGDLGAGKTCFVQGLAAGLAVTGARVTSPTFNIVLEHRGRLPLYHVDLYRIVTRGELDEIGLETYLYGVGVCAVEWMDRFPDLAPRDRLDVAISLVAARRRALTVTGHGARGAALLAAWLDPAAAPTSASGHKERDP